jgi:NAD(P)-dependent dehydrogenase (short-subunit alcohol dehydrogenase family)
MREAGGGTIINTSSESTFEVFPYQSIYCSTKASLEAFGRSMNFEYEKEEIRTVTLIQGVALGEGGGVQDWDHNPDFKDVMWPRLLAEGTIERVMGKHGGQDVDHVAEVHLFIATRPPGQKLDVVWSRSYEEETVSMAQFYDVLSGECVRPANGDGFDQDLDIYPCRVQDEIVQVEI